MRTLIGLVGAAAAVLLVVRQRYHGPGEDVLLPPGTPPDWRQRAQENNI